MPGTEKADGRLADRPAKGDSSIAQYGRIRSRSLELAAPLSEEDCCVQSMPDASPVKWHLAHTTWFFETFVLESRERPFRLFDPAYRVLFNSYYNGVGEKHPRAQRGLLTRPSLERIRAYRAQVDERMLEWLSSRADDAALAALVTLGLNHEEQHQELILTDVMHLLAQNPLQPAYGAVRTLAAPDGGRSLDWVSFPGGIGAIGHDGGGFCFDNELPRHRVLLPSFRLASRLTTNGEFLRFVEEGGYRNPACWLSDGWDWVRANAITAPLYWRQDDTAWSEFTLAGRSALEPGRSALEPGRPAMHLSYYEADAYARWAGARLPTEAEWEVAAVLSSAQAAGQSREPGLTELFGACWQWTSSSYAAYPGYRPMAGAIGEYNGKFMVNQYVLRGGSIATPPGHSRASYRNFFPASARWQFSGIRLARDD